MRPERTLRYFLENVAPPVTPLRPIVEPPDPFEVHADGSPLESPVIIMPAPGDAPLRTQARFPGEGLPTRVQDRERDLTAGWPRLARGGQAIGKSINFRYDAATEQIQKGIEQLRVAGNDLDGSQLCVTLGQPAIAMQTLASIDDAALLVGAQDIQGFATNDEIDPSEDFPGTGLPPIWPPLTAWIQWGTGGMQAEAFVDWVQGATINVTASYVSVVPVALPDHLNRPGTSALYKIGACVGPGWSTSSARRTVLVGSIDDAVEGAAFPVPPFAKRATVIGFNDTTPPVVSAGYLRFWQRSTKTHGVGDVFFNGNQPVSFDVTNGATYFSVFNQSGATLGFAVVFELAI